MYFLDELLEKWKKEEDKLDRKIEVLNKKIIKKQRYKSRIQKGDAVMMKDEFTLNGYGSNGFKRDAGYTVRPKDFDQFIGQNEAKTILRNSIVASNKMDQVLDHILFHGPPGMGKTSLVKIVINEKNKNSIYEGHLFDTTGPTLRYPSDIICILKQIKIGDFLFVDEVHSLSPEVQETLYPAMEDFLVEGQNIPPFTFIGATTELGYLKGPFESRYGLSIHLDYYDRKEMMDVIQYQVWRMNLVIDLEAKRRLAACSRETPRVSYQLLKRIRDNILANDPDIDKFDLYSPPLHIDMGTVSRTLKDMKVNANNGLHKQFSRYLIILAEHFPNRVGLNQLSATLGESQYTIINNIERYLHHLGLTDIGPRGRTLSRRAIQQSKFYGIDHILSGIDITETDKKDNKQDVKIIDIDKELPNMPSMKV